MYIPMEVVALIVQHTEFIFIKQELQQTQIKLI